MCKWRTNDFQFALGGWTSGCRPGGNAVQVPRRDPGKGRRHRLLLSSQFCALVVMTLNYSSAACHKRGWLTNNLLSHWRVSNAFSRTKHIRLALTLSSLRHVIWWCFNDKRLQRRINCEQTSLREYISSVEVCTGKCKEVTQTNTFDSKSGLGSQEDIHKNKQTSFNANRDLGTTSCRVGDRRVHFLHD